MFFVAGYPGVIQSGRRKLAYIMMVAMCILHVRYARCTVKHTQENVLKNVVIVTNGLGVSLAIPYLAIRIMLHVGWCIGGNLNTLCRIFKERERNPHYAVYLRKGNGTPTMPYKSVARLWHTFSETNCVR
jgi:hypothetical protein